MRVLWISNIEISDKNSGSGSWIFSMATALLSRDDIILGNIVPIRTNVVSRSDFKTIKQWRIPFIKNSYEVKLRNEERNAILKIVTEFKPNIVHIWGIENGYGLIAPFLDCPVLIEIQGINSEIANYYYGNLTLRQRLKLIGIKEILTLNPPSRQRSKMANLREREQTIIGLNKNFTTPTHWMRAFIESCTKSSICFSNGFVLRDAFYDSTEWKRNGNNIILTSASYVAPYKGLHVLIEALPILKAKIPEIELRIIGPYGLKGIRTNGYINYLLKKIKKLNLESNVRWLGVLSAQEICTEILNSSVFVNSSFIESAGMTILEGLALGIPIVSSFTGGIPSFDPGSILFFSPGDCKMCAYQTMRAMTEDDIIESGRMSREYISNFHKKEVVVSHQIDIYKSIL